MEIAVSMSARRRELAAGGGRPAVGLHATMDKIGTELRLHMRRTTTALALHKERTEKRMKMEVTNLTWEIPWIILVDVQLPDELNGKRLLLDFPSKPTVHGRRVPAPDARKVEQLTATASSYTDGREAIHDDMRQQQQT
uniref:Uncharacterized protein n=1 Tax=Oryza meridionalis TaxID=40149 RepID=A0A0E0CRG4_9ORYZ